MIATRFLGSPNVGAGVPSDALLRWALMQRIDHEVVDESVEDVIHSDCSQQLPVLCIKQRAQISYGEKCENSRQGRSRSEAYEYGECRHRANPATPADQREMNKKRGCESKAKPPAVLL